MSVRNISCLHGSVQLGTVQEDPRRREYQSWFRAFILVRWYACAPSCLSSDVAGNAGSVLPLLLARADVASRAEVGAVVAGCCHRGPVAIASEISQLNSNVVILLSCCAGVPDSIRPMAWKLLLGCFSCERARICKLSHAHAHAHIKGTCRAIGPSGQQRVALARRPTLCGPGRSKRPSISTGCTMCGYRTSIRTCTPHGRMHARTLTMLRCCWKRSVLSIASSSRPCTPTHIAAPRRHVPRTELMCTYACMHGTQGTARCGVVWSGVARHRRAAPCTIPRAHVHTHVRSRARERARARMPAFIHTHRPARI